jgi:endo-1,4-beta-xylanase
VNPKHLPGYGLKFSVSQKPGDDDTSQLTLTATNGDVGPAYATQITGLTLQQISGRPCKPSVATSGSLLLGDIPASGSASVSFTVDFSSCKSFAAFLLTAPWTSSTYHTGTVRSQVDFVEDNRRHGKP